MRWFVEISPLGKSEAEPEHQCVEASQWQEAIKGVRRAAGLDDALRNFSIEVLDEGVRAVDPMSRLRYVIRKAPGDAPLTGQQAQAMPAQAMPAQAMPAQAMPAPSATAPSAPPPAKSPSVPPPANKKLKAQTMVYGSPGAAEFNQAVQQAQAQIAAATSAPAPSAPAPSAPAPSAPSPSAPVSSAPASPAYTRAVFPPTQPESRPKPVYSAPQPAPVASSRPAPAPVPASPVAPPAPEPYNVLAKREEEPSKASPLTYREYAYAIAEGSTEDDAEKFLVARFNEIRNALSSTQSAKLVNLAVFDHQFKGKPKRPPLVTLVWKDWKGDPEVRFTSRPGVSIPPPSLGKRMPASVPPAKSSQPPAQQVKPGVVATPPSTPVAIRQNRGNLGPPQPTMRSAESAIDPSSLGAKVQFDVPAQVQPAPSPVAPQPAPVAPQPAPVAPQPAPVAKPVAPQPAPVAKPVAPQPAPVAPQPAAKSAPSRPSTGDEIIADIFESMHDLHFLRDAYEGADFVIALALDKMRCKIGIAQLYDINRREFVVAHAVGPGSQKALGNRTTERDPMLVEIMSRRTPFVIEASTDHRIREGRWNNLGGEPQTILACSVAQGGRFLGILELAHVKGEGEFRKADIDGMAYIAQSFAEFVAKTGLLFGSEENLIRG